MKIIGQKEDEYGEFYRMHCLEIYKLYVEMADRISSRRQSANSFFLSINTAIIAGTGYVKISSNEFSENYFVFVVGVLGIIICFIWYRLIRSYKDINSGKFKVIHEIEKYLPLTPFETEWVVLGEGKDSKLYLPFTQIEKYIPIIFGLMHFFMLLFAFPWELITSNS